MKREKKKKKERKFEPVTVSGRNLVWINGGGDIVVGSAAQAKRLADAFNREYRAITFKPKNKGRRARQKGHGFEREVAVALREVFPEARRHLEYQDSQANGVDLAETGKYRIQCKRMQQYAPLSKIEEVEYDPDFGDVPVLVTAADGKAWLAALPFQEFVRLLKRESSRLT